MSAATSSATGLSWFAEARWVQPQTLSVLAELNASVDVARLRTVLENTAASDLALSEIEGLHFLRMFVIGPAFDLRGRPLPGRLVLSAVFDSAAAEFLDQWLGRAHARVAPLFSSCQGFPPAIDAAELRDWLLARAVRPQTFYIGAVRHPLAVIREESRLRGAIQQWLDTNQTNDARPSVDPQRMHAEVRAFVRSRADLPQGPRPPPPLAARVLAAWDCARVALAALGGPALIAWLCVPAARHSFGWLAAGTTAVLGAALLAYFLTHCWFERREPEATIAPVPAFLRRVVEREDRFLQNQFTMLSLVRDSWFRRLHLRLTLFLSNFLSRHWWNRGELAGIGTIHFARIHQIDGGRRMLFLSDFDGSWERYLFDFLEVGAIAVVPNWSNLHGCPRARFGVQATPGFAQKFLPFTRANQVATELWYCAAPDVSMAEILRNARIRAGLHQTLNAAEARAWLALF